MSALAEAAERGWVDDATAKRLIAKYSGELVGDEGATVGSRVVVRRER